MGGAETTSAIAEELAREQRKVLELEQQLHESQLRLSVLLGKDKSGIIKNVFKGTGHHQQEQIITVDTTNEVSKE